MESELDDRLSTIISAREKVWTDVNEKLIHPVSKGVLLNADLDAVIGALKNIILTEKGSRVFQPNFGTRLNSLLFENIDFVTAGIIRDEIYSAIDISEPRLAEHRVDVVYDADRHLYNVTVTFKLRNGTPGILTHIFQQRT